MTAELVEPPARAEPLSVPPRLRAWAGRLAREPLAHFFAAGLALFAVSEHHRAATDLHRITVTRERVGQLAEAYRNEFGAEPSSRRLDQLVDHWVDEEALYREAQARHLDRDDEIVRRRLVQKMQFLQQDLAAVREPTEAELKAWYGAHAAQYAAAPSASFSHIFFADGAEGREAARRRAEATLASLSATATRAPERGDAFPDLYDYSAMTPEAARRLFGDEELSRKLFSAPTGRWSGPFRSIYGWHLVRVSETAAARVLPFEAVRDRVRGEAIAARQEAANRKAFEDLKARYSLVRRDKAGRP
ncbi:MAG TPA: peptidylprolyl isomerase [Phenylobacterium sp.]|uniref:peptidylprolyl isomerase n=1 Tax=Phenylobacterium sp. TaxID=1871053 RepID=UPI002B47439A|nr:peptidylprolyl isomerase [Phenylobacterium sp.]HKR89694.1 peptidylprolyl isomerase [Phenylobacterium sp.]